MPISWAVLWAVWAIGFAVTLIALRTHQHRRSGRLALAVDFWMAVTWPLLVGIVFLSRQENRRLH